MNGRGCIGVTLLVRVASSAIIMGAFVGCGDDTAPLGRPCEVDGDCSSGLCATIDGSRVCSEPCSAGQPCPGAPEDPLLTCREGDVCGPLCSFSGEQSDFRCTADGTVSSCAAGNDVADCGECGCSYFGGGRCVAAMGCIDPLADGASCTVDAMCQSNLCRPDTDQCASPIADGQPCPADRYCASGICGVGGSCVTPGGLGDPCREDRECESAHCNTDGNTSIVGACEIGVGRGCGDFISPSDPNCTICRSVQFGNMCFRENCNSTNATCPSGWTCLNTDGGGTACFQHCDPDRPFSSCSVTSAECSFNGTCSRTY